MATSPIIRPLPQSRRRSRLPQIPFSLRHIPWVIQPFCIHPVLPGETLVNLNMQTRAITDSIRAPLVGWWLEHMYFYVKLRDLHGREDFVEMCLDVSKDLSAHHSTNQVWAHYFTGHTTGAINWSELCLRRVVEEYFREPSETWNNHTIRGLPLATITGKSVLDSVVLDSDMAGFSADDPETPVGFGDLDSAEQTYLFLVQQQLTDMSYEDFLRTYGVRGAAVREETHRPELIRFSREWQYPSNTVSSDGAVNSAVSWSVSLRADKRRFFTEPGFVYGVTVARPKVYMGNLSGSAVSLMEGMVPWLPALLEHHPHHSMREISDGEGPFMDSGENYWLDIKDLLLYGEQFLNFDPSSTDDASIVGLPTTGFARKLYVEQADIDALFVGDDPACLVRQDGITTARILGKQTDTSVSMPA